MYRYEAGSRVWVEEEKLTASDGAAFDQVTGAEPAALALAFLVVHVAIGGVARFHAAKPEHS